jgi:hypothetical protein
VVKLNKIKQNESINNNEEKQETVDTIVNIIDILINLFENNIFVNNIQN